MSAKAKTGNKGLNAVGLWGLRIILVFWALITIFPLLWTVYTSFKSTAEFMASPWALPKSFSFGNYVRAWRIANFGQFFLNSVAVVCGALVITLVLTSSTAYAIAKFRNIFTSFLDRFYLLFMLVPQVLLLVPLYFMCNSLKLTDSLLMLMLLYALQGMPFYITVLVPFIKGINKSLIEAAEIDGAGEFKIFGSVVIPLIKPALYIMALLSVVGSWNEYAMALTFLSVKAKYTVPIGITWLSNLSTYNTDYGLIFAGVSIALIPIIAVYAVFQKPLQSGFSAADGIKG